MKPRIEVATKKIAAFFMLLSTITKPVINPATAYAVNSNPGMKLDKNKKAVAIATKTAVFTRVIEALFLFFTFLFMAVY